MRKYTLIEVEGELFFRQQNPLENERGIISAQMYEEHERLYIREALPAIDYIPGRNVYDENEIEFIYQGFDADSLEWIDINEQDSAFIETLTRQVRRIIRVKPITPMSINQPFQDRVRTWMIECFGKEILFDPLERAYRFLEEAIELAQAAGCPKDMALRTVVYTYSKPEGEVYKEMGDVLVTLSSLATCLGHDLNRNGEIELKRLNTPEVMDKIRSKQATRIIQNTTI